MTIPKELAFPISEYQERIAAIRTSMMRQMLDAIVVFSADTINYLSGMDNPANLNDLQCLVVALEQDPILVIHSFETGRAENSCWLPHAESYSPPQDPLELVASILQRRFPAGARVGIERRSRNLTADQYLRFVSMLDGWNVADPFGVVETRRLVKSQAEIDYIRSAAVLTDAAVTAAARVIRPGIRDSEVAAAIMRALYLEGSELVCWGPVVASGYRAGAPHSTFNGRAIALHETVFLEATGQVRRYICPIMKTFVVGEPTSEMKTLAALGEEVIATILRVARPGVSASRVARAGLRVLEPVLPGISFHQTFGYPVGIGYPPTWIEPLGYRIRVENDAPLQEGMVFHLPISLRKYGEFGINQSQTIAITANGAESLSRTGAEVVILSQ